MANNYYNFTESFVPGTKVRSDDMNNELDGITAGFDVLPNDPQSINRGTTYVGTESGSANAYAVARVNPQTSYENGDHVGFFATHDNTSSGTLDVDGLGAVALVAPDGSALLASDITDGVYYEAVFDTANNRWQLMTPMAGTLTEADTRVLWAQEWAINAEDVPVSTAAGGDDATTFSSLHWAAKSSDSADAAAVSEAAAAASYDEFDDRYLGSKSVEPTLDNDGNALLEGALYWNSVNSTMRVYNGSIWEDVGSSTANVTEFTATAAQTTFTGDDDNGLLLTYQVGYLDVHLNGVLLQGGGVDYTADDGTSIVLTVAANAGDVLQSTGFGTFDIANHYTKTEADARFAPIVVPGALIEETYFEGSTLAVTTDTWNPPANASKIEMWVVGGGGAGAGSLEPATGGYAAGGGGGGGAIHAVFDASEFEAGLTDNILLAGAVSGGSGSTDGLNGWDTQVFLNAAETKYLLASGGFGGSHAASTTIPEAPSPGGGSSVIGFTPSITIKSTGDSSGFGVINGTSVFASTGGEADGGPIIGHAGGTSAAGPSFDFNREGGDNAYTGGGGGGGAAWSSDYVGGLTTVQGGQGGSGGVYIRVYS